MTFPMSRLRKQIDERLLEAMRRFGHCGRIFSACVLANDHANELPRGNSGNGLAGWQNQGNLSVF
ncbi:MAG: hypothetical protein OXE85_01160 [Roseovarius sp.]|nr:hypothetical protein [Roseovarius sp.]MCY4315262.1 hypothetical protein [Roseovarius sp.]